MSTSVIDRAWIAARIPHQGDMCLLEGVARWSESEVVCVTGTHRAPHNPLRANGELRSVVLVEYAAQAMAVHCALLVGENRAPASGYLTSVREVRWHRARCDDVRGDLIIHAQRISGSANNALYSFSVHGDAQLLLEGRAAVVLDAAAI